MIRRLFFKLIIFIISGGSMFAKKEKVEIPTNAKWYDDYFTYEYIDDNTIAIGEPRYYQKNYSYLLLGTIKAILFDSGTGYHNIEPLVRSLTKLPVISIPSHFHFDHLGQINDFEETLLCKIQLENQILSENKCLTPTEDSFLGKVEGVTPPQIHYDDVLEADATLDIGNRSVRVIPVPGHARNSIALYDDHSMQLFIGDYMMPGILGISKLLVPDGSLDDTIVTANHLAETVQRDTIIYCSHALDYTLPVLHYRDIQDLADFLNNNSFRQNMIPKYKRINDNMKLFF
ncbi:MBL fold metallo-hydrolase [Acidaminobacter sp. JC074]|uniref:MBL fold metallo-hydrolase n=1 Tax=Acidaminobacter sp. JC074 TaxID=2530199 RepID=UPI001F0E74FB|nr:MBL fold metallo-hydrolase [Acidaminobacter sp. JC074]MCH4889001.1 MBL fold metallo-hydrolase [Acidaminobacter sp. JC074]